MPEFLELSKLLEHDTMTEVKVGGRGIDSKLYPQGLSSGQLLEELFFTENLRGTASEERKLFFRGHVEGE